MMVLLSRYSFCVEMMFWPPSHQRIHECTRGHLMPLNI